ncbi:MAG: mandelate racemase/muconate lactonizing enzyme family protein [Chitinophagaceae bacterium]
MRITKISLYKLCIPLKEPFITSLGQDNDARNVVVKIETDQGITGFGECSPYMPINGESQDTCYGVGQYFAKTLLGKDPLDIPACLQLMDAVIYANNSIKSAFDIALYDIAAQHAKQPLWQFIGGTNDKTIVTDYTVSIGEPQKMADDALHILSQGYPAIKVKLGKNGKKDVERMKAIREAVGKEIPLRIDANQGWEVEEAIVTLNALAPLDIQHCEEPIARWNYLQLPRVREKSPIPIMADESCGDDHDAARLIAINACQYFNIKLGKTGGINRGLKIVRLAEEAGIHLQVGAMIESRLAMTAFAHFALSSPLIVHFDFDTALMFKEDPVNGGIVYEKNGVVIVPDSLGLGASIDSIWLDKMEQTHFQ